jgi:hypothetical protein
MDNRFDELISSINGIQFKETKPEELEKLKELYGGKIPDTLLDYLKKHVPADRTKLHARFACVFYGIEEMIEENTDAVPGCNLHPMGLYTFASLENGDSICFDSNDPSFPVYLCSHSMLEDGKEILADYGKTKLPFEYENILQVSKCLGSSFDEFVMNMIKWKKETEFKNLIIKASGEKQYAKVVEAYEANPDVKIEPPLQNRIIASYNNLDRYDEALEVLDKFKPRFENCMRIWYYFAGYAYVGKEDCEKAEECIKAGIDECNREKKAKILKGTQYKNEVADFLYFQWQCQRIKALRLLKDRISSDSKLSEIIQVFKEMCQSKFEFEEGPLLLFEAYAGEGDSYTIHLVRQAEYLRYEEYYQLTADIEYSQEEFRQKAIREVFCNYNQDGDIFDYIGSSQAYNLLKDLKPSKFSIEEVDIEDCVSEKDIKLKTGGSLKENLTVNRKQVSNEEEIMALLNDDIVELEIGDHCLHIEFSEDGHAFIGWIDMYNDENYYFDNGSGNTESVDLIVNVCPEERMMCYDQDVLKEIVLYFCETGLRNPKYNWIEDTFE